MTAALAIACLTAGVALVVLGLRRGWFGWKCPYDEPGCRVGAFCERCWKDDAW